MPLPTRRLLVLALLPAVPLLVWPGAHSSTFALFYDVLLLSLALVDARLSPTPDVLSVVRAVPDRLSLGAPNACHYEVENESRHPLAFDLSDDAPASIEGVSEPLRRVIRGKTTIRVPIELTPTRRGLHHFGDLWLRVRSLLGLSVRQRRLALGAEVRVYPNLRALSRHQLAARRHRLAELGLSPIRRRGEGTTFESLREYVPGDDLADIAWKATARRGRLMTRNFEPERSQNILVVLDCGRLMTTQVGDLTRLDHAINATLLLTYVSMHQGDFLGVLAFSDRIESYLPPTRGRAALGRVNEALYRLEPRVREANYEMACRFLALRNRKRSLILIITDVVDSDASSPLLSHAAHFAKRHLTLCVTLRNLELESMATREAESEAAVYEQAVALDMLERRNESLVEMRSRRVDVLDTDPRELGPRMLTRYLEIKQRQRL